MVYAFLNSWRSTLITALSLPTSAIAAFIAVWLAGFTLNFMTLLGLSLAIGVLIDDAIVVRENIVRHLERGEDRVTAARNGTAEIGLAVAATTFSIMAVFVPVAFMGGVAGEWFRPFAVTVATSVLVSLFISFTLDPMLSAYWGDPPGYAKRERGWPGHECWRDSTTGSITRPTATAGSSPGRCITAIWMAVIAVADPGGCADAAVHHRAHGLPAQDRRRDDRRAGDARPRAPASTTTASRWRRAAELAREIPETKATNTNVNATGGRVYVDLGRKSEAQASARRRSRRTARRLKRPGGRRIRRAR